MKATLQEKRAWIRLGLELDNLLMEYDGIAHERKSNGSGGGKHTFFYAGAPQFEELEQSEMAPFSGG